MSVAVFALAHWAALKQVRTILLNDFKWKKIQHFISFKVNGTAHFKNVNNYLNTNIYSYLETSGGQSSIPYLNLVQFLNTSIK